MDKFAVFILSHGRPDNITTLATLKNEGYTGPLYILCDDEDATLPEYRKRFGDMIQVFNKADTRRRHGVDRILPFDDLNGILEARVASFDVARNLGFDYFLELDDDYKWIGARKVEGRVLRDFHFDDLDAVFAASLKFYKRTGALTMSFAQGGDFIGGADSFESKPPLMRKVMNSFFCTTKRPVDFFGILNEDVNFYTTANMRGDLVLAPKFLYIVQRTTQASAQGMSETYRKYGTFVKSFCSVIAQPSCVKVAMMGDSHLRIHHRIAWSNCAPKILPPEYRKEG